MAAKELKKTAVQAMPERILIIEGDKILITLIGNYVKNAGAKNVECVNDGYEAVSCLETKEYDLIILDWKFKNPIGMQLYSMIRQSQKSVSTPVILISGFVTKSDLEIAQSDMNAKFLVKPFTEEILIKYIAKIAGGTIMQDQPASGQQATNKNAAPGKVELHTLKASNPATRDEIQKKSTSSGGFNATQKTVLVASKDARQKTPPTGDGFQTQNREDLGTDLNGKFSRDGQPSGADLRTKISANAIGRSVSLPKAGPIAALPLDQNQDELESGADQATDDRFVSGLDLEVEVEVAEEEVGSELIEDIVLPAEPEVRPIILSSESVLGKRVEIMVPRRALIADQDESLRTLLANYLGELGSSNCEYAVNGDQAWKLINENEFDIILIDWRLKGLSGLNLYNRVRAKMNTKSVPLIVLTGFADKEDFRILGESPYSKFIPKPLNIEIFDETLRASLRDATVHSAIKDRMAEMLAPIMEDSEAIMKLMNNFLQKVPRPQIYIAYMGEHLLANAKMQEAESAFSTALRLDPNSVVAMTELSKIYHRTNRSGAAIKFLAKANTLSPENVERLCMIGEVGLNLEDPAQAKIYFDRALKIDCENERSSAGSLIAKNMEEHLATTEKSDNPSNFSLASSLNAVGITYIKNKQMDRARDQYKAAMNFIYDQPTMAKLQFNLGMAYLREQNMKDAFHWFSLAKTYGGPDFEKAHVYHAKVGKVLGIDMAASDEELTAKPKPAAAPKTNVATRPVMQKRPLPTEKEPAVTAAPAPKMDLTTAADLIAPSQPAADASAVLTYEKKKRY